MNERPAPRFYRRNLPHVQPEDGVFFITYNLNGSLPQKALEQLRLERVLKIKTLQAEGRSHDEIKEAVRQAHDLYFGKFDALLDNPKDGPTHLKNPKVAKLIMESMHWLDGKAYKLVCFTVMSNHVHKIVYKTQQVLWHIMERHKAFTGREANKILGLTGQFWQHESFDHRIRSMDWFVKKLRYTMNNAVEAKIVKHWKDYPYSWVRPEYEKYAP